MSISWLPSAASFCRRLAHNTRGGIALTGALSLTVMIGMGAFAIEATQGYAAKAHDQRIADMAALAGALAYNVNSDTAQMTATAKAVAASQGVPASAAAVALVTDSASGQQLVQVTITTSVSIMLGRVLTSAASYTVSAVGAATTTTTATTAPPCIAALATGNTGIDMNGGASISAPGCSVNANSNVSLVGGTTIGAALVKSGRSITTTGGSSITTSPTANNTQQNKTNAATDWAMTNTDMKSALCQVNLLTGNSDTDYGDNNRSCVTKKVAPTTATATGSTLDWDLSYQPRSAGGVYAYQTADYSCNYVIPAGTYTIRKLTVGGGCQISFANGSTLKFDNIDMNGSAMTVGDGSFTVVGTFGFNSGSVITIGNGSHSFGSLSVTGGRTLNIGSGDLNVTGAIAMAGGSHIFINSSVGDKITIGNDGKVHPSAITIAGGSEMCFTLACATPTALVTTFSVDGPISTAGGSKIVLPVAATHVINGDVDLNGSAIFGSGTYIIAGNYTNNAGGTMSGSEVTFALGGTFTLTGGTSIDLAAPGGLSSYGVPGVLVATKSTSQTKIGGGSTDKYAGLFYAPKSDMKITGGASISSSGAACMMIIANTITLSGSGAVATGNCSSLTVTSTVGNVVLFR